MEDIERSGWKMDFHLGSLKLEELMERMKERVPTEKDTREAPHEPLRSLDAGGGILSRRAADCRERERNFWEGGNGSGV
jgi:hypothetical protein